MSNSQEKVHPSAKKVKEKKMKIFLVKIIWIYLIVIYSTTNKVIISFWNLSYFQEVPWFKSALFAHCHALKVPFSA